MTTYICAVVALGLAYKKPKPVNQSTHSRSFHSTLRHYCRQKPSNTRPACLNTSICGSISRRGFRCRRTRCIEGLSCSSLLSCLKATAVRIGSGVYRIIWQVVACSLASNSQYLQQRFGLTLYAICRSFTPYTS